MRILLTNNTLAMRSGSELYVRDIARALLERGHSPVAYSSRLGEVAHELRAATIPVVDNLRHLPFPPDIIHGQHHLDTMAALLALPGVPAVYFCHGWLPWQEFPPIFPRILRYVAVDDTCLDRVLYEARIPPAKVSVMLNFVDLTRFQPRAPLPARPSRALVFSNYASPNDYAATIRQACAQRGIELDVVGSAAKTACSQPEQLLARYDLVFAKARAAMEAIAVGSAVVVCDALGCGEMVSTQNFDRLRRWNFGIRAMSHPITVETLTAQIARYDPAESARVSQRMRATGSLADTGDQLVRLYEEVLQEYASAATGSSADELQAAAVYLESLIPLAKQSWDMPPVQATQPPASPQATVGRLARALQRRAARCIEKLRGSS